MRRFSNTVIFGKTSRPSGESVSPLLTSLFVTRPCISSPFRSILPERGCKSPMIVPKACSCRAVVADQRHDSPGDLEIDVPEGVQVSVIGINALTFRAWCTPPPAMYACMTIPCAHLAASPPRISSPGSKRRCRRIFLQRQPHVVHDQDDVYPRRESAPRNAKSSVVSWMFSPRPRSSRNRSRGRLTIARAISSFRCLP